MEKRVLVLAPNGRDAAVIGKVLHARQIGEADVDELDALLLDVREDFVCGGEHGSLLAFLHAERGVPEPRGPPADAHQPTGEAGLQRSGAARHDAGGVPDAVARLGGWHIEHPTPHPVPTGRAAHPRPAPSPSSPGRTSPAGWTGREDEGAGYEYAD